MVELLIVGRVGCHLSRVGRTDGVPSWGRGWGSSWGWSRSGGHEEVLHHGVGRTLAAGRGRLLDHWGEKKERFFRLIPVFFSRFSVRISSTFGERYDMIEESYISCRKHCTFFKRTKLSILKADRKSSLITRKIILTWNNCLYQQSMSKDKRISNRCFQETHLRNEGISTKINVSRNMKPFYLSK